jgi:hypothetical protein
MTRAPLSASPARWIARMMRAVVVWLLFSACALAAVPPTPPPVATPAGPATGGAPLVIAWVQGGDLYVWTHSNPQARRIASGGVIRPWLAPDGAHVAYTRGGGISQTLWISDVLGTAEQQLVGRAEMVTRPNDEPLIGQVAWADADTVYFNTLVRRGGQISAQEDLNRAEIRTREVSLILSAGVGGHFSIAPDGAQIAVVSAGTYGRQDAVIRVTTPLGENKQALLFFSGVSSAASTKFYPALDWAADSSAVLVAIPAPDLVYNDQEGVALWRLPIANPNARQQLGTVAASYFGLPRWSADGTSLVYSARTALDAPFTLQQAAGDGSAPQTRHSAADLSLYGWTPAGYLYGTSAGFSLLQADGTTQAVTSTTLTNTSVLAAPVCVDAVRCVVLLPTADGAQFALWALDTQTQTTLITLAADALPTAIDAR